MRTLHRIIEVSYAEAVRSRAATWKMEEQGLGKITAHIVQPLPSRNKRMPWVTRNPDGAVCGSSTNREEPFGGQDLPMRSDVNGPVGYRQRWPNLPFLLAGKSWLQWILPRVNLCFGAAVVSTVPHWSLHYWTGPP